MNVRIAVLVAATAAVSFGTAARAQTAEALATFVIPAALLDSGPLPGAGIDDATARQSVGHVNVFSDGELCAVAVVDPAGDGDLVVGLGGDAQPPSCSKEGALVIWQTDLLPGEAMAQRFRYQAGATMTVTSLAPLIPEASPPPGTQAATIVIPGALVTSPIPDRGGPTWARFVGAVEILADGELCITADILLQDETDFPVAIGGPYQPEACSRDGALISFRADRGSQPDIDLDTRFTLTPGATYVLDSFAPLPPQLGSPAQLAAGEAFATVVIPREALDRVIESAAGGRSGVSRGELLKTVTIYANGQRCGTIDTVARQPRDAAGNPAFELGGAAQPDACRTPGALITFREAAYPRTDMGTMFFVERGATLVFDNFSGGGSPPGSGSPQAPNLGTGNAGNSVAAWVSAWLFAAAILLALVSAGMFWMSRQLRGER